MNLQIHGYPRITGLLKSILYVNTYSFEIWFQGRVMEFDFWRPSIPKDLLGRKFRENDFYLHRGAPFWKNFSKVEKIAILTPLKNDVPSPIEQWSITKRNQVMSWNYQIIWSSEVLRLWRKKKMKKFFQKKDFFFQKFFSKIFPPEP